MSGASEANFYRTGLGGVPVLGRLQHALIQPLDPMVSGAVATMQPSGRRVSISHDLRLSVFFMAVEDVPAGGSIDVEARVKAQRGPQVGAADMKWLRALFRSPWLFPKKTGADLERNLEKVRHVYGGTGRRFLHVTCHPIPTRWGVDDLQGFSLDFSQEGEVPSSAAISAVASLSDGREVAMPVALLGL